jgi:hypothetical protein
MTEAINSTDTVSTGRVTGIVGTIISVIRKMEWRVRIMAVRAAKGELVRGTTVEANKEVVREKSVWNMGKWYEGKKGTTVRTVVFRGETRLKWSGWDDMRTIIDGYGRRGRQARECFMMSI